MADRPPEHHADPPFDQPLEASLQDAARGYHTPPATPREAMWRAIEAQRHADRALPSPGPAAPSPRLSPRRPPAPRRWIPWGMAAAALLALGVGIGRLSAPGQGRGGDHTAAVASASHWPASRVNETAYRLATVDHLGQSEAFLTLFRASVQTGGQERLASATARQLLATNRLLLDSPAGRDRRTRLLLEDLELVLAEIAQLGPRAPARERDLIREGMERGGVLPRLRSVVPAGTTSTRGDL